MTLIDLQGQFSYYEGFHRLYMKYAACIMCEVNYKLQLTDVVSSYFYCCI